jgi:hypothetical protein
VAAKRGQNFDPTAPGIVERRVQARIARQSVLTDRNLPLRLSLVIDESALLREIGGPEVMSAQLAHLAKMIELPNVELRVHPMRTSSSLMASSFVVFGFGSLSGTPPLGDVVSAESVASGELYVEGETDTYLYRLLFSSLLDASLTSAQSKQLIIDTARDWTEDRHTSKLPKAVFSIKYPCIDSYEP